MSNRVEPEIPNISLDDDLVKTSPNNRGSRETSSAKPAAVIQAKPSKTLAVFTFGIYAALAGTGYFFYQENLQLKQVISNSEDRIQQLEDQLSATGEEMGESTVALRAKLEAITEKTEKLWGEMDKLWASAWRRNQSEIKELNSASKKQKTQQTKLANSISTVTQNVSEIKEKQTATEFSIDALSEQLTAANNVKKDLSSIDSAIASLESKYQGRSDQQMEVATSVNELNMQITLLIERIEKLEVGNNQTSKPTAVPSTAGQ